jgi:hypothetical protein
MSLKSRLDRVEKKLLPAPEIKTSASLWDETIDGPWPETEEAKKAYEAERGCKIIWVEGDPKPGQKENL